jgi:hypothetical protein
MQQIMAMQAGGPQGAPPGPPQLPPDVLAQLQAQGLPGLEPPGGPLPPPDMPMMDQGTIPGSGAPPFIDQEMMRSTGTNPTSFGRTGLPPQVMSPEMQTGGMNRLADVQRLLAEIGQQ